MKVVWGSFGSSDAIFKDVDMPLPYEMAVRCILFHIVIISSWKAPMKAVDNGPKYDIDVQFSQGKHILTSRYANSTESIELAYLDGFRRVFSSDRFSGYCSGYADLGIAVDQFRRLRPKPNIISTILIWASKTSVFRLRFTNMMLGGDVGTQYRSGIYYYNDEQERLAKESLDSKQNEMKGKKIVTEILPTKRFYRAEEYHQQYLAKGGRNG
ncbi:hypothetical protein QQ045_018457 [Rhodiola kirilowii]